MSRMRYQIGKKTTDHNKQVGGVHAQASQNLMNKPTLKKEVAKKSCFFWVVSPLNIDSPLGQRGPSCTWFSLKVTQSPVGLSKADGASTRGWCQYVAPYPKRQPNLDIPSKRDIFSFAKAEIGKFVSR